MAVLLAGSSFQMINVSTYIDACVKSSNRALLLDKILTTCCFVSLSLSNFLFWKIIEISEIIDNSIESMALEGGFHDRKMDELQLKIVLDAYIVLLACAH